MRRDIRRKERDEAADRIQSATPFVSKDRRPRSLELRVAELEAKVDDLTLLMRDHLKKPGG